MKKLFIYLSVILAILSCSKDDGTSEGETNDTFYSDNNKDTSIQDLVGTWAIYTAEYDGQKINVPDNFPSCGKDYFSFESNGNYTEYIYQSDNCSPVITQYNWELSEGIISLSDVSNLNDEIAVVNTSANEIILKYRFDVDEDGRLDILMVTAKRYDPKVDNPVAKSFRRDVEEDSLLQFNWDSYKGLGEFDRYEIYRSSGNDCSKAEANLIATIDDSSIREFIDMAPPATQENICYFLKVFSNNGLIGESNLLTEDPTRIKIAEAIYLDEPLVGENNVELSWDSSSIPYFSHYEIAYANSDGSNLLFHEEASITDLYNIDTSSYNDLDPPYLENPYFVVYVHNIFGTKIPSNYQGTTFRRTDLLGPINLYSILYEPEEPIVYFYGNSKIPDGAVYNQSAIIRYNYQSGNIESYTDFELSVSLESPINFIESPEGKEIIIGPKHFIDPITMSEIFSYGSFYLFEGFEVFPPAEFLYTKNGYWAMVDQDNLFIFSREGQQLNLIDKQVHYSQHHGDNYYRMLNINTNQILIGHKQEDESILFTLNENGEIQDKVTVPIAMSSELLPIYGNKNISFYSESHDYIINYADKKLYSTQTFDFMDEISENFFALGVSLDGQYVFGTSNDPKWFGSDIQTEFFTREALIYNVVSKQTTSIDLKGYPIRIFENNLGEIISVSVPENQIPIEFDIFVEKLEIP